MVLRTRKKSGDIAHAKVKIKKQQKVYWALKRHAWVLGEETTVRLSDSLPEEGGQRRLCTSLSWSSSSARACCPRKLICLPLVPLSFHMEVSQYTLANQTNEWLERTAFKICLLHFIKTLSILVPEMQTVRVAMGSQRLGHDWVTELNWWQSWLDNIRTKYCPA